MNILPIKITNDNSLTLFINIIISLLANILIYIWWREPVRFIQWIPSNVLCFIQSYNPFLKEDIPDWIKYHLVDGLFTYSIALIYLLNVSSKQNNSIYIWLFVITISFILLEVFQYFQIISGKFDILDICSYILGITASYILYFKLSK